MNPANNPATALMAWLALICLAAPAARAQEPGTAAQAQPPAATPGGPAKTSKSTAQLDAGEPQAQTSAVPAEPPPPANEPPATTPAAQARSTAASGGHAAGKSGPKAPAAADRVDLGVATVTGDREQPKVMYIVPWKRSDIGDLSGKPMNSLLDEALAPIDRDEFRREVVYYGAVKSEGSANGAPNKGAQGEK